MVLLTMTPAMVHAVEEFVALATTDPQTFRKHHHNHELDEPDLNDPKIGKPISHGQLIDISTELLKHWQPHGSEASGGKENFRLDHLLHGSTIYVPPAKCKPEPTAEYRALMERLRFDEENRAYTRMLQSSRQSAQHESSRLPEDEDDVTYADVDRQVALIVNILVSIVACSCAIWMASSHWDTPRRLAFSMAGSGLVAIAEVVVYAGYLRRIKAAKHKARKQTEIKTISQTWMVGNREKIE